VSRETSPAGGVGTQLTRLLQAWPFRIESSEGCACRTHALVMDRQGVDWCEENVDAIVGWLRQQAEARGLPFLDIAGRMLVRRAIANARRNA
jgi:hypothetical protein